MNGIAKIDMEKIRFLLDTNVVISVLNKHFDLLKFLDTFPDCEVYINPVVMIEVLSKPNMNEHEESAARFLLDSFRLIEIDKPVCDEAVKIRRTKELRLPDALIAASSIILNATVLSNDSRLLSYHQIGYKAITTNNSNE